MSSTAEPTYLAEISEASATGTTREIYSELKRLGGVPMAALIFRHLATIPGGLEWAWNALAPALRSGRLQEESWRIARETPMVPILPIPLEAVRALGVDGGGLADIHAVVDAYNRANPTNFLAVTCLSRLVAGASASVTAPSIAWDPPKAAATLLPMIDVTTMPASVADLFALLSKRSGHGDARLVPSLYRHIAHQPQFLALLLTLILPRFDDGSIARGVSAIRRSMDAAALELARGMSAPPTPSHDVGAALQRFGGVIPQMIVVGALLKRALPIP